MVKLSVTEIPTAHLHMAVASTEAADLGARPSPETITGAVLHTQKTPAAEWRGTHQFARLPDVTCYVDGVQVDTDVSATDSSYLITWPDPTAGQAIIR